MHAHTRALYPFKTMLFQQNENQLDSELMHHTASSLTTGTWAANELMQKPYPEM